ncbi:MAG: class 1 fructose-bisphosphatase [Rhodocyclaceae bacterium]|nr:class 1 fructose-bisphosphatase [Rhodocyclaceae bacterium]
MPPADPGTPTLAACLARRVTAGALDPGLARVVEALAACTQRISTLVGRGGLSDILGSAGQQNVQGETQKKLDVISNDMMIEGLAATGHLAALASEELDHHLPLPTPSAKSRYLALFDPLDGSSNIDINAPIGTIFSVLPAADGAVGDEAFLQPGRRQVAAGYALYGPATELVLTWGEGVDVYTLDRACGEYTLTDTGLRVPVTTSEYAINASNQRFWEAPLQRYVAECQAGSSGPRGRDFNMRWNGSMVGDVHRVLRRGGVFLYPRDNKLPRKAGRLRLMYEANPMALLAQQAGALATDGVTPLLDLQPTGLHQRVPVVLGSLEEVERIARYHAPV